MNGPARGALRLPLTGLVHAIGLQPVTAAKSKRSMRAICQLVMCVLCQCAPGLAKTVIIATVGSCLPPAHTHPAAG